MDISKLTAKVIGPKKEWRRYKARKAALPEDYRTVLDAVQRYTYYRGPVTGDAIMSLLEDLIDVFEQAAAGGTPIQDLVGEDPVGFAEGFIDNYRDSDWVAKERQRLTDAVEKATGHRPEDGPAARDTGEDRDVAGADDDMPEKGEPR